MIPIVTINFNGSKDTIDLLNSLEKSKESYNLILVDNCSPDKSDTESLLSFLRKKYKDNNVCDYKDDMVTLVAEFKVSEDSFITFIQSKSNLGFSGGTNIGLRYAVATQKEEKYCCILNNDTIVTELFVTNIIKQMELENISAAMGTILFYGYDKSYIWSIGGKVNWLKGECTHVHKNDVFEGDSRPFVLRQFVSGCFTVFNTEHLISIGFLDESYFFGTEEFQYSIDLTRKGYKLAWVPSSIIYHKSIMEKGNGSSHNISELCWQYNSYMNKIIFINKNKGLLYRFFWRLIFKSYINFCVKKKYLTQGYCGKSVFSFFRESLFKNIKSGRFTCSEFYAFKEGINGFNESKNS